nr:XamI family restriction endonuclease [uncultured Rhodopila sp.]
MQSPPIWTESQIRLDAATARSAFRAERLVEPLERWQATIRRYRGAFERLFNQYNVADIKALTAAQLADIFATKIDQIAPPAEGGTRPTEAKKLANENLGAPLRYLAGPPISEDDLAVLAEVSSIAPAALRSDSDAAGRVLATIVQALDTTRFAWIAENRPPTDLEKTIAIATSAALITAQRVSTDRRNEGKDKQETLVKSFLTSMGFTAAPSRTINTLDDAPLRGQFCGESKVGTRKADVAVRLHDGRLMPIECKVSNSEVNSVKRINNDAAAKAVTWRRELGINQVVPVALMSGVFKVANLVQAQEAGLTLFWAHDLDRLRTFIENTRTIR